MLCKKIINFFSLLSRTGDMEMKKLGITQELLSLVTGLAHYLKNLIRVTLNAALRLVYYPLERKRTCVLIYIYTIGNITWQISGRFPLTGSSNGNPR